MDNLKDVLKLAIENTGEREESQNAPNLSNMDPDRRAFLEEAFKSMNVSIPKEMQICINTTKEALRADPIQDSNIYHIEISLEKLINYVSSIDNANDFVTIGGTEILRPLLELQFDAVRSNTAELVAELCQNNPACQKAVLEADLLPVLLHLLDQDPDVYVSIKALYAISCLTRQNIEVQEKFDTLDGFSYILRAIQKPTHKLRIKAAFLLASLCTQDSNCLNTLYNMGFVEQLVALLNSEHDASHEHLLSLLLTLASNHTPSQTECRRGDLHLEKLLLDRINLLGNKEEYQEEREYCQQLLTQCFNSPHLER